MIHIATLTDKGSRPLCGQPLLDDSLVGDRLGDDLSSATCPQCKGLQAKLDAEAEKWED